MDLFDFAIWPEYGLTENPYFYQALQEDRLALFRGEGRTEMGKLLARTIHSRSHPIILLEGGPGVGKTSLVNYTKEALRRSGEFFVYPRRIEISVDSTREALAADYLAALTTTAMAQEPDVDWREDPRWEEAYETIAETWETGGLSAAGSFAGFGAGVTLTQVRKVAEVMPWETWKALVENILDAILEQRRGLVVHVNNVDAVCDENPEAARQLFDEVRDLLSMEGLQTVLCASPTFREEVIADRQRLLDVIKPMERIEQLEPDEFIEAVHARYNYFATGDETLTAPVEDKALREFYRIFDGDMRNVFQVASSAVVKASMTSAEPEPLSLGELMVLEAEEFRSEFESLTNCEQDIVEYLMEHGDTPSQTDIRNAIEHPKATVSQASNRLEHKRWIATESVGRRREYELSGYGCLLKRVRDVE